MGLLRTSPRLSSAVGTFLKGCPVQPFNVQIAKFPADVTGSVPQSTTAIVKAGQTYKFSSVIGWQAATPSQGIAIDFSVGNITATSFSATLSQVGGTPGVAGVTTSSALATSLTYTTTTGVCYFAIFGTLVVNTGNQFGMRLQNAGTFTIFNNTWLCLVQ